jgi:hypothetical protein
MPEPEKSEPIPAAETLQFRKAEHGGAAAGGPKCVICARPIVDSYYHAQGQVVCPACAKAVEAGQNAPPVHTLAKSFAYGLGAALAGTALFSIVWMVTDYQLALIAILIGFMVGKAVRKGSKGLGGRPQQIMAVLLTYFSISASYIPVSVYHYSKEGSHKTEPVEQTNAAAEGGSLGGFLVSLLALAVAAPFMSLGQGLGGLLTLFIIFIGLQRAWQMTGRSNILVMGPYQADA